MGSPSEGQLIAALRNTIGETATDFYSDVNLRQFLNDSQYVVAAALSVELLTSLLAESTTYAVANVEQYGLPRNMFRLMDVSIYAARTERQTCRPLPIQWFRETVRNKFWVPHADLPMYYVSGGLMVGILPRPTGSNTILFRFVAMPSTSGVSDVYKLPDAAYPAVIYHAAARCKEKEGAWQESQVFQQLYERTIQTLNGGQQT